MKIAAEYEQMADMAEEDASVLGESESNLDCATPVMMG